jgi:hypothetical protein
MVEQYGLKMRKQQLISAARREFADYAFVTRQRTARMNELVVRLRM